jgi:lipid-A-disaccharide synthase
VPQVVCYKANPVSYHIAKFFVSLDYISLVNLNMQEEVVRELIQDDMTVKNIIHELEHLTNNKQYRENILNKYEELKDLLDNRGASKRVAQAVYDYLKN